MPYIGNQPGTGVRSRFIYTATASQTTFTGADNNSKTLKYADSAYVDVFLNGVCLVPGTDYTASTKTSIVLTQAASLSDTLEVIAYDIASMSDMSASNGGTFQADVTFADGADIITASKGTDNVRLGEDAGASIASGGDNNVTIGKDAGTAITTGSNNTVVGHDAGAAITTGTVNTFVGNLAGDATTTSHHNTGIGHQALTTNVLGSNSVAVGSFALNSQNPASATDMYNTAVGYNAGQAISTGDRNVAVGATSLDACTSGQYNVAVGNDALTTLTTGDNNVAVGINAGAAVTTGEKSIIIGSFAGDALTTGGSNVVVGYSAMGGATTASLSTVVGYQAGEGITTGERNNLFGVNAGQSLTTGASNTFIGGASTGAGNGAGKAVTTGSKNTILGTYDGNQDGLDIRTSDGNIVLSNGDGEYHIWIDTSGAKMMRGDGITAAQVGNGAATGSYFGNAADFYSCRATNSTSIHTRWYNSNGQVGRIETTGTQTNYVTSSDYRLKENVTYNWDATTRLKQLKPARFNFIADADTTVDGFLAHEAGTVVPEAVSGVKDGVEVWNEADDLPDGISAGDNKLDVDGNTVPEYQGIDHSRLVPLLVKTIQELEARITALEGE